MYEHASNNVVQRSAAGEFLMVTSMLYAAPADHGVRPLRASHYIEQDQLVRIMSNQLEENKFRKSSQRLIKIGNDLLARQNLEESNITFFRKVVASTLEKEFPSDLELVRRFNTLADNALLDPDPRVGLQRLMLFVFNLYKSGNFDIFLSYASADQQEAILIYESVEKAGGKVFLAAKSLSPGDDFAERIREALWASHELWLLVSPNSLKSDWVVSEWGAAWVLQKRIVPILHRCNPENLPDRIRKLHCVDFYQHTDLIRDFFQRKFRDRV